MSSPQLSVLGKKKEILSDIKCILETLPRTGNTIFELANAAFVKQKLPLRKAFQKVAKECFSAWIKSLNFAQSQEAADTINKFVENRTNNLIKNLLNPNSLNAATTLVLGNALRFKGNWSKPFSPSDTTKDHVFTHFGVIQVNTLHHYRMPCRYHQSADLKVKFLELPFKDSEGSMVIVYPANKNDFLTLKEEDIVKMATSETPFKSACLNVALPKFKFEYKIDFKKILTQLGVSKIFDLSEADLSGIAGDKGDGAVGEIVQKAYIDLNEFGLEADIFTRFCHPIDRPVVLENEPKSFIANQPFIFLLKYQGTIIFVGRIVEAQY